MASGVSFITTRNALASAYDTGIVPTVRAVFFMLLMVVAVVVVVVVACVCVCVCVCV